MTERITIEGDSLQISLTVGSSICTGYGGLELALDQAGIDHRLAWCSEIDEHASKVIARRFPHAPNLGDINDANPTPADSGRYWRPTTQIRRLGERRSNPY